jgi:class 3 adenylate cyclase/tetratricopeptide (TPR) repeat protein
VQTGAKSEKPAAERRLLTTLFSDICGYTSLSEAFDPEELEELVDGYRSMAIEVIGDYGGVVNQFMGDGLLALFGVPAAHDDDAQRAVGAALTMHREFARRSRPFAERWKRSIDLHAGIETGLVVTKHADARAGVVYAVTGDAVNVAARLLAMAGPGEILIGPRTKPLVAPFFVLDSPRELALKGKAEVVIAHPVLGVSTTRTRFEFERERGLSRFVGRQSELDVLRRQFGEFIDGPGRTVFVSGPPGAGKTRLLDRFLEEIGERAQILQGRADPYGEVGPYEPFLRALREKLGISDTDSDDSRREKGKSGLSPYLDHSQDRLRALLQILSLEPESMRSPASEPSEDGLRLAVEAGFIEWFRVLAQEKPVVLLLEDWHWADESSRDLLAKLAREARDAKLFLLVTQRPHRARFPLDAVEIDLPPLPPEDVEALAASVLAAPGVPEDVLARVRDATGGNPLFVEELCRSLVESGVLVLEDGGLHVKGSVDELAIPTSVEAVIRSRLDALDPGAAEVLHSAAVLGAEFRQRILEQIVSEPASLLPALQRLEQAALLQARDDRDDRSWRFSHALIRGVAYDSLRHRDRRELHLRVAETIEQSLTSARRNEQLEILAHHYDRALCPDKALEYTEAAGMKALATHALGSARQQLGRAIELIDALPVSDALNRRRVLVTLRWAQACIYAPDESQIPSVRRAAELARGMGDDLAAGKATTWQGWLLYAAGRQKEAIECCEQGLADLAKTGNRQLIAQLQATLGQSWAAATDYERALPLLEQGIAFWHELPDRLGRGVGLAYALGYRCLIHGDQGRFEAAYASIGEALEIVARIGKEPLLGSILTQRAIVEVTQGNWSAAAATAAEMRRVAQRVQAPYVEAMSRSVAGAALFHGEGKVKKGIDLMRSAAIWMHEARVLLTQSWNTGLLAEALALTGAEDDARVAIVTVFERSEKWDRMGECLGLRARALTAGGAEQADALWREAVKTAEKKGALPDAARTRFRWAEAMRRAGRDFDARALCSEAEAALGAMGMPRPMAVSELRPPHGG